MNPTDLKNVHVPTTLDFHKDMSHHSILALEIFPKVFPKGCSHHDLKPFPLTEYNKVLYNMK